MTTRTIALSLTFAGLWSSALLVGSVRTFGEDLGPGRWLLGSIPLAATLLVAVMALAKVGPGPVAGAFVVVGLLGIGNLLAMLTVGIFVVPATGALLIAAASMRVRWTDSRSAPWPPHPAPVVRQ